MRTNRTTYDVFLSHGAHDTGVADVVCRALEAAGLSVFTPSDLESGLPVADQIRESMRECLAVVVLLGRSFLQSDNVAFEVGAAAAWNKPIYLLLHGLKADALPTYLRRFRAIPLTRHGDLVRELALRPGAMAEDEIDRLRNVYVQVHVPADSLAMEPTALDRLTRVFNRRNKSSRLPEELLRELFRMRKRGGLPRVASNGSRVA